MWIRFKNPFDWRPRPGVIVSYRPGQEAQVTHECAEAAINGGYAVAIKSPTRTEAKARKMASTPKNLKVEIDDGDQGEVDRKGTGAEGA